MIHVELPDHRQHLIPILLITMAALMLSPTRASPYTDPPIFPGKPFLCLWNAPTELCATRFGMPLDLSQFDTVSSTLKTARNQTVSIFYTDRFGVFPYVDQDTGEVVDQGLPQLLDWPEHNKQAREDIEFHIPSARQPGLAVLDLEEWRPQWVRNWGSKDIYRQISISTVQERHNGTLDEEVAEDRAEAQFERAAKRYFIQAIRIGKSLRPKRLWGYYLYPDCYNYDYNQDMASYTGRCPAIEQRRNDKLLWLWGESTALYPSIYLELVLKETRQARLFVRHRIREAMRVSMLPNSSYSIPIYAYIRPVYKDSVDDYMSEADLVSTIGEAAALGVAGVVSWGDMNVTESEDSCYDARVHLERVMNPYLLNVSSAAHLCSLALCGGQGRCVRKRWDEDVFLHLDPSRFTIQRKSRTGPLSVSGGGPQLSQLDVYEFDRHFDCLCYSPRPCRHVKEINVLPENNPVVRPGGGSAERRVPLLLIVIMLFTKHVMM